MTSRTRSHRALVSTFFLLFAIGVSALQAANPTSCTGGPYDPPNNGGTTNFTCVVSGNSGALSNVALTSTVTHSFNPCINEHTFRLLSPTGTEHLIGTRNGTQTANITTFNGQSSNGTWTFRVSDSNGNDACGDQVNSWSLNFSFTGPVNPTASIESLSLAEDNAPLLRLRIVTEDGLPTTGSRSVTIGLDPDGAGSATIGSDYAMTPGVINVPAGTTSNALLPFGQLIDDAALERDETLRLVLSNANGLVINTAPQQIFIADDEIGTIGFVAPTSTAPEAASAVYPIPIRLTPSSGDGTASIDLFVFGTISRQSGTASQGTFNVACPNSDWSFFQNNDTGSTTAEFYLNVTSPTWSPRIRVCNDGPGDNNETITMQQNITGLPANVTFSGTHVVTISETDLFRNGFE